MIKLNEVTWYSRLLAGIFFVIILPVWAFYLGTVHESTESEILTQFEQGEYVYSRKPLQIIEATSTANWITYLDQKNGFQFKHPPEYVVVRDEDQVSIYSPQNYEKYKKDDFRPLDDLSVTVYPSLEEYDLTGDEDLRGYLEQISPGNKVAVVEINGVFALRQYYYADSSGTIYCIVTKDGGVIYLNVLDQEERVGEQMVSTFKLLQ